MFLLATQQGGLPSVQLATPKPGTRENSLVLLVTSVASRLRAWAAIKVSSAPIGFPCTFPYASAARSSKSAMTRGIKKRKCKRGCF